MVIYGYDLGPNEHDQLEYESFRRNWELGRERIYKTLNGEDREILINIYEDMNTKLFNWPSEYFVDKIAWRSYTEWCMNPHERGNPDNYNGEAFKKFINDETSYAIKRLNRHVSDEESKNIRYKVLKGLVRRADEFFFMNNKEENLGCSLERYIEL